MTVSVSDLITQREAIERQIRALQSTAKADAIAQVRRLMTEHGLTASDLEAKSTSPAGKRGIRSGSKVAPKYRDPETGATWTGRGLKPKWLAAAMAAGKTPEDFAI